MNVKIGPKLIGGFVAVAALCVLVGIAGLVSMSRMSTQSETVTLVTVPQLDKLGDYQVALASVRRYEFGLLVARQTGNQALFEKYTREYQAALTDQVQRGADVFEAIPRSPKAEAL
ncbi:MAG: MCP four helix bundle domain-containing protein [Gemmatimonadetes bacterium]|nr:MCP four helix bundle domain-containing protein [Gemmatimonadota bacterium]